MANIIFHLPYTRTGARVDASLSRPSHLIDAFRNEGHTVYEVSGLPSKRRSEIRHIQEVLRRGDHVDFMYSESHAVPNVLANWKDNRILQGPFLDYGLFRMLRSHGVPTALFLRDIKWSTPDFMSARPRIVRMAVKAFYGFDLWLYRRSIDLLYVPTEPVRELVPIFPQSRIKVLPPAGPRNSISDTRQVPNKKRVIYVGNVGGDLYSLHPLLDAAAMAEDWTLTMCVPEAAWILAESEYSHVNTSDVEIVHVSGERLAEELGHGTIGALVYPPHVYRDIAFPAKILEYCAFGLPIVVGEGTYAAEYVARHEIGWSCPPQPAAIARLLNTLPVEEIARVGERARDHAVNQTWDDRVRQIVQDSSLLPGAHS